MTSLKPGRGLERLQDRFVSRAVYLTTDESFLRALATARAEWNERFPEYLIRPSESGRKEPPARLMADFQRSQDARPLAEKPWWRVPWQDFVHQPMKLLSKADEGMYEWDRMIAEIGYTFWPQIDFPDPVPYSAHPARIFITVGLYPTDEFNRWGDVDDYFPPFKWEPEPIRWRRGVTDLWPEMADDVEMDWYLPLYPGLTGRDLKRAAPAIARKLDDVYKHRSLDTRVKALRENGETEQAIANQLGISRKNVIKILKST